MNKWDFASAWVIYTSITTRGQYPPAQAYSTKAMPGTLSKPKAGIPHHHKWLHASVPVTIKAAFLSLSFRFSRMLLVKIGGNTAAFQVVHLHPFSSISVQHQWPQLCKCELNQALAHRGTSLMAAVRGASCLMAVMRKQDTKWSGLILKEHT